MCIHATRGVCVILIKLCYASCKSNGYTDNGIFTRVGNNQRGGRGAEGVELLSTTSRLALCKEGRGRDEEEGREGRRQRRRPRTHTHAINLLLHAAQSATATGRQAGKLFLGLSAPSVGNFHRPFYIVL